MRFCSKCGDFYSDPLLAFCLADGTPLVEVDPKGDAWNEGVRIIDQRAIRLTKQKRNLKWRRVALSAAAVLITTRVVWVVAVDGVVHQQPEPDETAAVTAPTTTVTPPETTPPSAPSILTNTNTIVPANANVKNNHVAANASANANVKGHANLNANVKTTADVNTNTHADTNTHVNTNANSAVAVVTSTVVAAGAGGASTTNTTSNVTSSSDTSVTNKNVKGKKGFFKKLFDHITVGGAVTAGPASHPNPDTKGNANSDTVCSEADQNRERQFILDRFRAIFLRNIEGERGSIIAHNVPADESPAQVSLSPVEYAVAVSKKCTTARVTARYAWQIRSPRRTATIPRQRTFDCMKDRGSWTCR